MAGFGGAGSLCSGALLGGGALFRGGVLLRYGALSLEPGASHDVAGTRRPAGPALSEARLGFSAGASGSGGESSAGPAFGSSLSPDGPEVEALGGAEDFAGSATRGIGCCTPAACLGGGAGACLVVAGAGEREAAIPGPGSGKVCGTEEAEVLCSRAWRAAALAPTPVRSEETVPGAGALGAGASWIVDGAGSGTRGCSGACSMGVSLGAAALESAFVSDGAGGLSASLGAI